MSKKDEILWLDLETGKTRPFSPDPVEEATKWAEREDALHRAALKYPNLDSRKLWRVAMELLYNEKQAAKKSG